MSQLNVRKRVLEKAGPSSSSVEELKVPKLTPVPLTMDQQRKLRRQQKDSETGGAANNPLLKFLGEYGPASRNAGNLTQSPVH